MWQDWLCEKLPVSAEKWSRSRSLVLPLVLSLALAGLQALVSTFPLPPLDRTRSCEVSDQDLGKYDGIAIMVEWIHLGLFPRMIGQALNICTLTVGAVGMFKITLYVGEIVSHEMFD